MGIQDRDYYREWAREQRKGNGAAAAKTPPSPPPSPPRASTYDEWWDRRIGPNAEIIEVNGTRYLPPNENGPYAGPRRSKGPQRSIGSWLVAAAIFVLFLLLLVRRLA